MSASNRTRCDKFLSLSVWMLTTITSVAKLQAGKVTHTVTHSVTHRVTHTHLCVYVAWCQEFCMADWARDDSLSLTAVLLSLVIDSSGSTLGRMLDWDNGLCPYFVCNLPLGCSSFY